MIAPGLLESILPIDHLRSNEQASVIDVVGEDAEVHRLSEMGLRAGVQVRMIRPGSPCLLALEGKRLSLRVGPSVEVLVSVANSN